MDRKIFNEEHQLFRKTFRQYLEKKIIPHLETWDEAHMVPREVWLDAGEQGWLCPTASKQYGGLECDFLYSVIIQEELAYAGASSVSWGLHSDIVLPYIENFGSEAQKQKWIPKCISGECVLAIAMTEPAVGSDLANLKTRAVRQGDHYIVNGAKVFISNGQCADLYIVAVRTEDTNPPHRGVSLLLIEGNTPGFQRGRNLKKIGMQGQDTSELFFEDCKVPVENLLGKEGMGFKYLMNNLQQERLVIAIGAVGAAKGALKHTIDYVKTREIFGKPLSKFQNTQFELADMSTKVQIGQSFIDDLLPRHMAGENVVTEVSMAKYWTTDMQFEVSDRCLQLFGGYGYMQEYPISRFFVDARVQRIYGGANEVMKDLVARGLGL
ncbi:MAG: acyl-CoA dehydrogenase family protein [SAR324 cluster bacterium]|nr:acyl-CoA dehydrogenase family protein [SAR324 cluster bacterium]